MKNVAFGQAVGAFQIERRQYLASENRIGDVGRVLGNLLDHAVAEQFALLVPGAFAQMIGNVLHEAGQDVLAGGASEASAFDETTQSTQSSSGMSPNLAMS